MILRFWTGGSRQTVQTQIRLLLIRVYTVCNSVCIFWMHCSMVKPSCSSFKVITANCFGVWMFRMFMVSSDCGWPGGFPWRSGFSPPGHEFNSLDTQTEKQLKWKRKLIKKIWTSDPAFCKWYHFTDTLKRKTTSVQFKTVYQMRFFAMFFVVILCLAVKIIKYGPPKFSSVMILKFARCGLSIQVCVGIANGTDPDQKKWSNLSPHNNTVCPGQSVPTVLVITWFLLWYTARKDGGGLLLIEFLAKVSSIFSLFSLFLSSELYTIFQPTFIWI